MTELSRAKELLLRGEYTCVLLKDNMVYTSKHRGVKPLVRFLKSGDDFREFYAADKVIGKATAFLYVLLKVRAVYASVISESALKVLIKNNINVVYETLVKNISNRRGDGICPFEQAVLNFEDAESAYGVITVKMQEMGIEIK